MTEVRQTAEFGDWLHRLADANAVARIVARIRRMELGNLGDSKSVGGGLSEMRVDYVPGYRIYCVADPHSYFCRAAATSECSNGISSGLES